MAPKVSDSSLDPYTYAWSTQQERQGYRMHPGNYKRRIYTNSLGDAPTCRSQTGNQTQEPAGQETCSTRQTDRQVTGHKSQS